MRYFVVLLLLCCGISQSQTNQIDSLLRVLSGTKIDSSRYKLQTLLAEKYSKEDDAKCVKYWEEAAQSAEKIKRYDWQADSYNAISRYYFSQKKYLDGYSWLERLENLGSRSKDTSVILTALDARKGLYQQLNQLDKAVEIEQKKQKIFHARKETYKEAFSLYLDGWMSFNAGLYKTGLIALHKSRSLFASINEPKRVNTMNGWIGNTHNGLNNYDSALYYRALVHDFEVKLNSAFGIGESYRYTGDVYFKKGDYEKALELYNKSISYFTKAEAARSTLLRTYKVRVLNAMGRYEDAAQQLDTISGLLRSSKDYLAKYYMNSYGIIAYEKTKQYDKAFKCLFYLDSINKVDKTTEAKDLIEITEFKKDREKSEALVKAEFEKQQAIANANIQNKQLLIDKNNKELLLLEQDNKLKLVTLNQSQLELKQKQLESEDQQRQVELLNKDKKLARLEAIQREDDIKRQRIIIYGFAVGGVIVLILLFFVVRGYLQKRKDNKLINEQKLQVEEKQKEIVDSINYAKRIQYTLLAHDSFLKENIADHFIYFKPKDIVSGDFYWATKKDSKFYLAICDCTGHGVPGAFMSLLNIGFLSEAINEKGIEEPSKVFDFVRKRLIDNISKEGQKDGFDGILLCIDKSNGKLTYAAANNKPILLKTSSKELFELPGDRMPVGIGERTDDFNLYTIDANKGDFLYLYTDGYADQFGGPKGKKYKYKQLNEFILAHHTKPSQQQKEILSQEFETWRGNLEQVDDVCVIGIKL